MGEEQEASNEDREYKYRSLRKFVVHHKQWINTWLFQFTVLLGQFTEWLYLSTAHDHYLCWFGLWMQKINHIFRCNWMAFFLYLWKHCSNRMPSKQQINCMMKHFRFSFSRFPQFVFEFFLSLPRIWSALTLLVFHSGFTYMRKIRRLFVCSFIRSKPYFSFQFEIIKAMHLHLQLAPLFIHSVGEIVWWCIYYR